MNLRFCFQGKLWTLISYVLYLSLMFLLLQCWKPVQAQQYPAVRIGEKVPDLTIPGVIGGKSPSVKLADFRGKLLILDFWATWCSPCVAMIPVMDSLQNRFADKVQFLPVTYQSASQVNGFISRYAARKGKRIQRTEVVSDKILSSLFPHNAFPHYIWIDQNGIVKAITGMDEITAEKIQAFLDKPSLVLSRKEDAPRIPYTDKKPFLVAGNGGDGSNLMYHSVLACYTDGLASAYSIGKADSVLGRKVTASNLGLQGMFQLAYGEGKRYFGKNRTVVEVENPSELDVSLTGNALIDWFKQGHGFCYEVIVPFAFRERAFDIMRRDLTQFFPMYQARVESRLKRCLVLERTSANDKLASKKGAVKTTFDQAGCSLRNTSIKSLTGMLAVIYMQGSPMPIVDQTGYKGAVDLDLEADLTDVGQLNTALAKYDLRFVEREQPIELLIIGSSAAQTH